jgi:hypothetical protein
MAGYARHWLRDLLTADDAVKVVSGRRNRTKLLYRLPEGVQPPITKQIKQGGAMILEFRCAAAASGMPIRASADDSSGEGCGVPMGRSGRVHQPAVLSDALLEVWTTAKASSANMSGLTGNPLGVIVEGGRNLALIKLAGNLVSARMAQKGVLAALLKKTRSSAPRRCP